MTHRLLTALVRRWDSLTLGGKIIIPLCSLMVVSLFFSIGAYIIGTSQTQTHLLEREANGEMNRLVEGLTSRTPAIQNAAVLLARDEEVINSLHDEQPSSLPIMNQRALAIKERLQLDFVQIYNKDNEPRVNLLSSSLYRESNLISPQSAVSPSVRLTDGHLLLISQVPMQDNIGTVIAGIDLESELNRAVNQYRLLSNAELKSGQYTVNTMSAGSEGRTEKAPPNQYIIQRSLQLGNSPVVLRLLYPIRDIQQVTTSGLIVISISIILTTLLIAIVTVVIIHRVLRPVHHLAAAAENIMNGDISQQIAETLTSFSVSPHSRDEISLLSRTFNQMLEELHKLYLEQEKKISDRTIELAAAEERYRKFFEEDLAGDFICDPEGRILACNSAFARLFAFESIDSACRHDIDELFNNPSDRELFWQKIKDEKKLQHYEVELVKADGEVIFVVENIIGNFNPFNELTEIKGYIFDNTESRKLEQQLQQSQKMEAIGRLAGGVAHDFNNLLTVILGYCELLQTSVDAAHGSIKSDASQYAISQIRDAGEKAAGLTRQLLAFSRKQVLQLKIINLNDTIENLSKMLRRLIGEDIELSLSLTPELHKVSADPGQIEQVIMNLVVNSREAMPDGGKLLIETQNAYLDNSYAQKHFEVQPGSYAMIAVTDTGFGIPAEDLNLIFEPFFTTKETGTGLGLATVYGIIKQSGGHINVYSEVGIGTTFKIYLPIVEKCEAVSETEKNKPTSPMAHGTILLVEDEDTVRNLCQEFLTNNGFTVLIADCGSEALKLIRLYKGEVDLLVTDMIMPGMNGHELAKEIVKIYPEIGILFMSGYTNTDLLDIDSFDNRTSFLNKPFSSAGFLEKVNQILKETPIRI